MIKKDFDLLYQTGSSLSVCDIYKKQILKNGKNDANTNRNYKSYPVDITTWSGYGRDGSRTTHAKPGSI